MRGLHCIYVLTNPYHSDGDFGNKIVAFVEGSDLERLITGWAPIYVIDSHIPQIDLPSLYKAADVFVLPSRGKGWVGQLWRRWLCLCLLLLRTEYLTDENSFPLPVDRMSEVAEGPFKGHFWAEPSVDKLGILMSNREEALAKGKKAREDMINRFSPEIVAKIEIQQVLDKLV